MSCGFPAQVADLRHELRRRSPKGNSRLPESLRPVKLDLRTDGLGNENRGEVEEQVEAADFVEVDQRTRVTDDF